MFLARAALMLWTMGTGLAVPEPVAAQDSVPRAGPRFMYARYASEASLAIYAGYTVGPLFAFAGAVQNPRTEYREALLGLGASVTSIGGNGATFGLAGAYASDGWYGQLYLLPTFRLGPLLFDSTIEGYLPLEGRGVRQLCVTPAYAYLPLSPRVAIGATYLLAAQPGQALSHAGGPSLRVSVPRGSLTLDVVRRFAIAPSEWRLTAYTRF
jgi:hypothetical protein